MSRLRLLVVLALATSPQLGCEAIDGLVDRLFEAKSEKDARSPELAAAIELVEGGDCGSALPRLEALAASEPDSEEALYYLGRCRLELAPPPEGPDAPLGELEQASLDAFRRALAVNPRSARALIGIGDVHARRARPPRRGRRAAADEAEDPYALALESYRKAVTIDPGLPEAQRAFARFLEKMGEYEEAEQAYRAATEAAATVPEIAPDYYMDYGRFLAEHTDRLEEAMNQYELAQMFRQDDEGIRRELAVLHGRLGREYFEKQQYALAEDYLTRAYEMFPRKDDPEAEAVSATLRELRSIRRR